MLAENSLNTRKDQRSPHKTFGHTCSFSTDLVAKGCIPESIEQDISFGCCFKLFAEIQK